MSTVNLTTDTFESAVTDNDIVLVDWWADWCGPCKMFAPIYDQAADAHPDVVFGKVDTEDQQALAAGAGITSIPTIMAFKEGVLVFRQSGALPARDLDSVITQVKALDMDEVRAKMAASQA
ncbi:thioredoxin [Ornithinimicrobium tianjinense]|uniref:thioredoxin n=1 Tax=Ornithinimicrobium tianjinense TaxID=1195761 RepID=UPI00166D2C00|nr:thioredoxin [Ornithinimicrobium tianjinense]